MPIISNQNLPDGSVFAGIGVYGSLGMNGLLFLIAQTCLFLDGARSVEKVQFKKLKVIMQAKDDMSYEKKSWEENGLFPFTSFDDLFQFCDITNHH